MKPMTNEELEKRIIVLEDIEAITQLNARYCAVCDDDHNPNMIAPPTFKLFHQAAVVSDRKDM
jgi:hypothetical protein